MGRLAGNRAYWLLKLCFLLFGSGAAFSGPPAGGVVSCALPDVLSAFPPLLFFVFLAFSFSWDSLANVVWSEAPSSGGRVSWGRSEGVGFPSACSSLGVFMLDGECFLLVQVELKGKNTFF